MDVEKNLDIFLKNQQTLILYIYIYILFIIRTLKPFKTSKTLRKKNITKNIAFAKSAKSAKAQKPAFG